MSKLVALFPGQASQIIGMGRDLFKDDSYFNELIDFASDYTNTDLKKITLKGPEKELVKAANLQPIMTAVSLGYFNRLKNEGVNADLILGHSLGEITALAATEILSSTDTIKVSAKRGVLMDAAATKCNGAMMAVLFVSADDIVNLISEMNLNKTVSLANDNAPTQIILSGDKASLKEISSVINERQLGKCKPVFVSGPWHSEYLQSARDSFKEWVQPISFSEPKIDMIFNATAKVESDPETIKSLITEQLIKPVYWRDCMEQVKTYNPETILEVGSGRVLSGLIRVNKFPKTVTVISVNDLRGVANAAAQTVS